jgi:hypothetical protein
MPTALSNGDGAGGLEVARRRSRRSGWRGECIRAKYFPGYV